MTELEMAAGDPWEDDAGDEGTTTGFEAAGDP